jgi:hypothetical protein
MEIAATDEMARRLCHNKVIGEDQRAVVSVTRVEMIDARNGISSDRHDHRKYHPSNNNAEDNKVHHHLNSDNNNNNNQGNGRRFYPETGFSKILEKLEHSPSWS